MGHDKLRKFAENETFSCLLQPSAEELLADGYFHLRDHAVKGHWNDFFSDRAAAAAVALQERATLGIVRGGTASEAQRWGPTKEDVLQGELQSCKQENEIVLELGCGKGEYTVALAERDPERNYIGVDIKGARLWKGAKYATEHALPNVAFLRTRVEFITAFFAPGEVSEIWLTFSDPQYRSENSRLSSPLFLERYRSFMKPGGTVHLKTDSRFLHEYTRAVCEANGLRILACTTDLYGSADNEPDGSSPLKTSGCAGPLPSGDGPLPLTMPPDKDKFPWKGAQGVEGQASLLARFSGGTAAPASTLSAIQPVVKEVQTFYEQLFLEQGYPITYLSFVIDHEGPFVSPRDPEQFDSKAWRAAEGPRLLFGHDSAETRRQKLHAAED